MAEQRRYLEFIYTPLFERSARGFLDDESMRHAELQLLADPRAGATVAGTGGCLVEASAEVRAWPTSMSRSAAACSFSWRMPRRSSSI